MVMRTGVKVPRRARLLAVAALIVSLLGGAMVLLFAGGPPKQPAALAPVQPSTVQPVPDTPEPTPGPEEPDLNPMAMSPDSFGATGTDANSVLGQGDLPSGGSVAAFPAGTPPVLPVVAPPALPSLPTLPAAQLPQFPAAPSIDWQAALQPYIQSQIDAAAANMASSITGTAAGAGAGALNSAAVAVGDLLLFATYVNNGQSVLAPLESAAPALSAGLAALPPPPDLSGLSAAFAAAAAQPPLGVPSPPLGLALPTPDQVAAALAVPALGVPAVAIPLLPPPPPIGLPALPPPPPFGLPSITRLFGLPF